jgi:hypothetical protein
MIPNVVANVVANVGEVVAFAHGGGRDRRDRAALRWAGYVVASVGEMTKNAQGASSGVVVSVGEMTKNAQVAAPDVVVIVGEAAQTALRGSGV